MNEPRKAPRPIDLQPLKPDDRAAFVGRILLLLRKSPFRRVAEWRNAVVVFAFGEKRVTSRADFAGWLRANDLRPMAHECRSRRIPPGHVLVWLSADNATGACAGFALVDMIGEVERARQAA